MPRVIPTRICWTALNGEVPGERHRLASTRGRGDGQVFYFDPIWVVVD